MVTVMRSGGKALGGAEVVSSPHAGHSAQVLILSVSLFLMTTLEERGLVSSDTGK